MSAGGLVIRQTGTYDDPLFNYAQFWNGVIASTRPRSLPWAARPAGRAWHSSGCDYAITMWGRPAT